ADGNRRDDRGGTGSRAAAERRSVGADVSDAVYTRNARGYGGENGHTIKCDRVTVDDALEDVAARDNGANCIHRDREGGNGGIGVVVGEGVNEFHATGQRGRTNVLRRRRSKTYGAGVWQKGTGLIDHKQGFRRVVGYACDGQQAA